MYIDGDAQPALEAPAAALLSGRQSPFAPPLAHVTARGHNLYFPFPFARRCVVTVDDIVSPDPFTGRRSRSSTIRSDTAATAPSRPRACAPIRRKSWRGRAPTIARVAAVLRDGPAAALPDPAARTVEIAATTVEPRRPSITRIAASTPAPGRRRADRAAHRDARAHAAEAALDAAVDRVRR